MYDKVYLDSYYLRGWQEAWFKVIPGCTVRLKPTLKNEQKKRQNRFHIIRKSTIRHTTGFGTQSITRHSVSPSTSKETNQAPPSKSNMFSILIAQDGLDLSTLFSVSVVVELYTCGDLVKIKC